MASIAVGAVAVADIAWAQSKTFDVPAQPAATGVAAFARQADVQILISAADAQGRRTNAVRGAYPIPEALRLLLAGTGLSAQSTGPHTWTVVPVPPAEAAPSAAATESAAVSELIVTAQKREERLLDVPAPVTVVAGRALADRGQIRLADYYQKIPGLNLSVTSDAGEPAPSIRGIATGGNTAPVVGIVVDEIPYGATTGGGFVVSVPDIDPGDVARIEVLRGPQGALYGASAMGGLLKYVTIDPSLTQVEGRLEAGLLSKRHSDELGHLIRGALSVPVSETLAVRLTGFTLREPGYVDNNLTAQDDADRLDSKGGRATLLWRPMSDFSVKLSAALQDSSRKGLSDVDTALGSDASINAPPGTGIYRRRSEVYASTVTGQVDRISLVSATGFSIDRSRSRLDNTPLASALPLAGVNGYNSVVQPLSRRTEKFSQELRATIPLGERIAWLVGAFYTSEDLSFVYTFHASQMATGELGPLVLIQEQPATYREHAIFSTVTVELSDQLDVQLGGRVAANRQTSTAIRTGPWAPIFFGANAIIPTKRSSETSTTYLVTPRFRVSPDLMIYGRLATGYRPGGPNVGCGIPGIPCEYGADETRNYEVGAKGRALNGRLTFDLSAYHIAWKDTQLTSLVTSPTVFSYVSNAGAARSRGIELSASVDLWEGFTLSGWVAHNDAEIAQNISTGFVVANEGDALPYTSRWSGNLSASQVFQFAGDWSLTLEGSVDFVGKRLGLIRGARDRPIYPSYTQVDLRAELEHGSWRLNAFVTNLTNERGVLRGGQESVRPTLVTYTQPRTVGVTLGYAF